MLIKVKKFGGTSLSNTKLLSNAANIIKKDLEKGLHVVVVVSAASGHTESLLRQIMQVGYGFSRREEDVILAAGEQISAGLLAMALNVIGIASRSFCGWQVPIITDDNYGDANILDMNNANIMACLHQGVVPVIAGFQGVSINNSNITTLGRGGSDTTAIAVAKAVEAFKCEIYTDVDGVYSADPKIFFHMAHKLTEVPYVLMLEASQLGAKIMHHKSAAMAMKYAIKTEILSSFDPGAGTTLVPDDAVSHAKMHLVCSRSDVMAVLVFGSRQELLLKLPDIVHMAHVSDLSGFYMVYVALQDWRRAKNSLSCVDFGCFIERLINKGGPGNFVMNSLESNSLAEVSIVGLNIGKHIKEMLSYVMAVGIKILGYSNRNHSISFIVEKHIENQMILSLHAVNFTNQTHVNG